MTTFASSPAYCAYLLRCWHEASHVAADGQGWRFSLEDPHTGARHGFASLDAVMTFLHKHLRDDPCSITGTSTDEQASKDAPMVVPV